MNWIQPWPKPRGSDMKTIILFSAIGGVSKTTITFNLARFLADKGRRVAVVDADLQQNITEILRLSKCKGIDLVPLKGLKSLKGYDYCLIDTSPGFNTITKRAFLASDYFIMPVMPDNYNIQAVALTFSTIEGWRKGNPRRFPEFLGFIVQNHPHTGAGQRACLVHPRIRDNIIAILPYKNSKSSRFAVTLPEKALISILKRLEGAETSKKGF